jgi:uncharacterized protein DUF6455
MYVALHIGGEERMSAIGKFGVRAPRRSAFGDFAAWGRKVLVGLASHGDSGMVTEESETVPASESDSIFSTNPEASLRLTVMMRRLGLVRDEIRDRRVLREIESNCASCDETGDCRDWLRSKKTVGYRRFCLNAWRFDRLLALRK